MGLFFVIFVEMFTEELNVSPPDLQLVLVILYSPESKKGDWD